MNTILVKSSNQSTLGTTQLISNYIAVQEGALAVLIVLQSLLVQQRRNTTDQIAVCPQEVLEANINKAS